MSLLSIIQGISDRVGLPVVNQVVGNTQNDVRQLRSLVLAGGNALCEKVGSQGDGWSILERIYEFQTEADKTEYDLPDDFKRLTVETAWQKDKYWKLRGSMSGRDWQRIRNRQASISYNVYRILRKSAGSPAQGVLLGAAPKIIRKFTLEPAPEEGVTLVYEYISDAWWVNTGGSSFRTFPADDSYESLFGDEIHILDGVWRFKAANGLQFATDLANFELYRDTVFSTDAPKEDIQIGYDRRFYGGKDESDVAWCP